MDCHRHGRALAGAAIAVLALGAAACSDQDTPTGPQPGLNAHTAAAPTGLVTAAWGGSSVTLWPYTTEDFGVTRKDPINLLFVGNADPRAIRAALLALDGDRTPLFPDQFPFNCTWSDVPEGGIQASYSTAEGWAGSAIQLACGPYGPIRFHLRLFRAGAWTMGGAHFEFNVPGTTEHQVLSWEGAEQLVAFDMYRTGLAAPVDSAAVNDAPGFHTVPAMIVPLLPPELLAVLCPAGVPWPCDGSADVPILNSGRATIVYVWGGTDAAAGAFAREQTVTFDQVIPKPFCAGGAFQYLYVYGPIAFREHWVLTPSNNYLATFEASGTLALTPIDPMTGQFLGETYQATVYERHRMQITDNLTRTASALVQMELPPDAPFHGTYRVRLQVGSNGVTLQDAEITCGS